MMDEATNEHLERLRDVMRDLEAYTVEDEALGPLVLLAGKLVDQAAALIRENAELKAKTANGATGEQA